TTSYIPSMVFFFSSRRRHTRFSRDWSSDVCSSDLTALASPSAVSHHHLVGHRAQQHHARKRMEDRQELTQRRENDHEAAEGNAKIGRACVGKEWRSRWAREH